MIKRERITEKSRARFIPFLIIGLFFSFFLINILGNHNSLNTLLTNRSDIKELSWEASKRYYQIIHYLSDSGFIRCDGFLGNEKCNSTFNLVERRIPIYKGRLIDSNVKNLPYNTLKELSVILNPGKKLPYVETIYTGKISPKLTANIVYLLSISKKCDNTIVEKWIFSEKADLSRNSSNFNTMNLSPNNFLYFINDNFDKKNSFLKLWKLLLSEKKTTEKELLKLWCY